MAKEKKTPKLTVKQKQEAEKELRAYVRRDGGFRVGLKPNAIKKAEQLLKDLKREEPKWDTGLLPG